MKDTNSITGSKSADAYLLEAAMQLRPENVTSLEDLQAWMTANLAAIAAKASDLQTEMWNKLQKPEVLKAAKQIISAKVWAECNKREFDRKAQMEIEAAVA